MFRGIDAAGTDILRDKCLGAEAGAHGQHQVPVFQVTGPDRVNHHPHGFVPTAPHAALL